MNLNLLKEISKEIVQKKLEETTDYKYALEEFCILQIIDQQGIINYVNDHFCEISKYSREELIGQEHSITNSDLDLTEPIPTSWLTIANGKIGRGELKNKAKDGNIYWLDTTIVPFSNKEVEPYQYVCICTDITTRKETEEQLEKSLHKVANYKYALIQEIMKTGATLENQLYARNRIEASLN